MKKGTPSKTAEFVALHRAAHQLLDHPLIFEDPLAIRIIGAENERIIRAEPDHFEEGGLASYLRAMMAVRSRYTEDELARAVEKGVHQYVVLGAGLDTFAYRNPFSAQGLTVFEVDSPATQDWKRDRLAGAHIQIPSNLHFVSLDFEAQTLADGLHQAGFDFEHPAFFSWLGVTMYLTVESVLETLSFIAGLPPLSSVIFDYAVPVSPSDPLAFDLYNYMSRRAAAEGEPWKSAFEAPELIRQLYSLGFTVITALPPSELAARYFANRMDNLAVGPYIHLMNARVE